MQTPLTAPVQAQFDKGVDRLRNGGLERLNLYGASFWMTKR